MPALRASRRDEPGRATLRGFVVTAGATARALLVKPPGRITLVAMGNNGVVRSDEDELCALHLRNLLEGPGDPKAVRRVILAGSRLGAFATTRPHFHPRDLDLALEIDRYDFAISVNLGRSTEATVSTTR